MEKPRKFANATKVKLLKELNDEVVERFGGNKAAAAEFLQIGRIQFTNLCNGKDSVSIDKLLEIATKLNWEVELRLSRKKVGGKSK